MSTELKTKLSSQSPESFINSLTDPQRKADSLKLLKLMAEITGQKPELWGQSIIGYGRLNYKYASGKEDEWMKVAFSPRKANLTIYIMSGFDGFEELLTKLGPYKMGKSCLYIKKLDDIDIKILTKMIKESLKGIEKNGILAGNN
jgi:hypothetical protein